MDTKNTLEKTTDYKCKYPFLFHIPSKNGRYIIVDTETTGIFKGNYLIEIGAIEFINGSLTHEKFNAKFDPIIIKNKISKRCIKNNHKFNEEKNKLNDFRMFVGNSLVFAHNATFDMKVLNKTLSSFDLEEIPFTNFRCTMKIFLEIINTLNPLYNKNSISLKECCKYYRIDTCGGKYHNANFDSIMTSKLLIKLYNEIENNIKVSKYFNFENNDDLELHYKIYQDLKRQNNKINSYFDDSFLELNQYEIPGFLNCNTIEIKNKKLNNIMKNKEFNKNDDQKEIENKKFDFELGKKTIGLREKTDLEISRDIVNKIINEYNNK